MLFALCPMQTNSDGMATGPLRDERLQPLRPDADPGMGRFRDGEELSGVFEGACDAESVYCAVLIFLPRMDTDEHGFFSGAVIASERGERGNPLPAAPSVTARGGAHTGDCFGNNVVSFIFAFMNVAKKYTGVMKKMNANSFAASVWDSQAG